MKKDANGENGNCARDSKVGVGDLMSLGLASVRRDITINRT